LQAVGAKDIPASVALVPVAGGAEELPAPRAGDDHQNYVSALFVILDWYAFKESAAVRAGGVYCVEPHKSTIHSAVYGVKRNLRYTALWSYTPSMVDKAAARLGKKGGQNSRKYLDPEDATALAQKAVNARWAAYYAAHPEKLQAKLERALARAVGLRRKDRRLDIALDRY
jgi:hypothetical protein